MKQNPVVYKRLYKIMKKNYVLEGCTLEDLYSVLKYITEKSVIENIIETVSWVRKTGEYYYFNVDAEAEVIEQKEKNDPVIYDTDFEQEFLNREKEQKSFEEILHVRKAFYRDIDIALLGLSQRGNNVLKRLKCRTIEDLLAFTPRELYRGHSVGKHIYNEIVHHLNTYCQTSKASISYDKLQNVQTDYLSSSSDKDVELNNEWQDYVIAKQNTEDEAFNIVIREHSIIDRMLYKECLENRVVVENLIEALLSFCQQYLPTEVYLKALRELIAHIPEERLNQSVYGYILAYADNEGTQIRMEKLCVSKDMTVIEYLHNVKQLIIDREIYDFWGKFIVWLTFDLESDVAKLKTGLFLNDREKQIIELRSKKKTLEYIGQKMSITKERVRQIEIKVRKRFEIRLSTTNVLKKIGAVREEQTVKSSALHEYFCSDTDTVLYLMKVSECQEYAYDSRLDTFTIK